MGCSVAAAHFHFHVAIPRPVLHIGSLSFHREAAPISSPPHATPQTARDSLQRSYRFIQNGEFRPFQAVFDEIPMSGGRHARR